MTAVFLFLIMGPMFVCVICYIIIYALCIQQILLPSLFLVFYGILSIERQFIGFCRLPTHCYPGTATILMIMMIAYIIHTTPNTKLSETKRNTLFVKNNYILYHNYLKSAIYSRRLTPIYFLIREGTLVH
jgi:hypothetical protein